MMRSWLACGLLACGCSRTGLDAPSHDADIDVIDASIEDATPDIIYPLIDGAVADADRTGCPDGGVEQGLLVTVDGQLLRFDPKNGFTLLGPVVCPSPKSQEPESMAVARDGTALVFFATGPLLTHPPPTSMYRIDPTTLACSPTAYAADGNDRVGMGFTTNGAGPTETLFIVTSVDAGLYTVDTSSFTRSLVAPVDFLGELAGGGDGRLFSFFPPTDDPGARLVELDKTTGAVIAADPIYDLEVENAFAFFRIGTLFYMFTENGQGGSFASSYDLATKKVALRLFSWPSEIVGAGASTCASQ